MTRRQKRSGLRSFPTKRTRFRPGRQPGTWSRSKSSDAAPRGLRCATTPATQYPALALLLLCVVGCAGQVGISEEPNDSSRPIPAAKVTWVAYYMGDSKVGHGRTVLALFRAR